MWSFPEMSRHSFPCTQPKASWYICVVDLGFVAGTAEAQSSGKNCCTLGWEQVQSLTPGLEFAFLFWGDTKLNAGWGEQKGELWFCGILCLEGRLLCSSLYPNHCVIWFWGHGKNKRSHLFQEHLDFDAMQLCHITFGICFKIICSEGNKQ